jgi:DNA (cytosine-5)-methyltransferase 1
MRCGHLFNGIGGFALAAHWMGWANIMHCEIDPFCNNVMNHHFQNSHQHEDIRTTDFTIWNGRIDLITGGFPCQPYSTAGKRKGKDDERHLWPEMLRAIREIQPSYVVGENVRGLTNWNEGMVFDEVQADLEAEGYEVLPFLLPAASVNAPHRRDRIWFIAHSSNAGAESMRHKRENSVHESGVTADAASIRRRRDNVKGEVLQREQQVCGEVRAGNRKEDVNTWSEFPTQSPVCSGNDGVSGGLVDISVPGKNGTRLLSGQQAFGRWRKESIKALGNSIVPQVALQIFKTIEEYTTYINSLKDK